MFLSYSTFIEESQSGNPSSLQQLIQWCGGPDFNGVIMFDECQQRSDIFSGTPHPKKKCLAVLKLQNMLPKARIVYVSSSGALEPRTMECMIRLGLWGPGTSFQGLMFLLILNVVPLSINCTSFLLQNIGTLSQLSKHFLSEPQTWPWRLNVVESMFPVNCLSRMLRWKLSTYPCQLGHTSSAFTNYTSNCGLNCG